MSEALTYDDMGNIRTLTRDNGTAITYGYNNSNKSNRLASLSGGVTGTFTYDVNGNATKDRTGMVLTYNHLNLPKTVIGTGKNISYTYDAVGSKLSRLSDVGGITTQRDYIGGIEYSKIGTANPVIERIGTEDGFLLNSSGTYSYYYNLTDHLGNVRVVLKKEGTASAPTAAVMQKQDYYPFGKTKSIATSIDNKYLYNGKEMQTDLSGGTHALGSSYVLEGELDYGARFYDAEIGRWNVVDKLADHMNQIDKSPYAYSWNNPTNLTDPDGNCPLCPFIIPILEGLTVRQIVTTAVVVTAGAVVVSNRDKFAGKDFFVRRDGTRNNIPLNPMMLNSSKKSDENGDSQKSQENKPKEAYNRRKHYGNTPKKSDRKEFGANPDEVVDHDPELVKRYYEGDPKTGEKPGYQMTPEERKASANDRTRMRLQPKSESNKQGADASRYSREQKKKNDL
ncbi:hypothetical protein D3C87_337640 [compost metagenome]